MTKSSKASLGALLFPHFQVSNFKPKNSKQPQFRYFKRIFQVKVRPSVWTPIPLCLLAQTDFAPSLRSQRELPLSLLAQRKWRKKGHPVSGVSGDSPRSPMRSNSFASSARRTVDRSSEVFARRSLEYLRSKGNGKVSTTKLFKGEYRIGIRSPRFRIAEFCGKFEV